MLGPFSLWHGSSEVPLLSFSFHHLSKDEGGAPESSLFLDIDLAHPLFALEFVL